MSVFFHVLINFNVSLIYIWLVNSRSVAVLFLFVYFLMRSIRARVGGETNKWFPFTNGDVSKWKDKNGELYLESHQWLKTKRPFLSILYDEVTWRAFVFPFFFFFSLHPFFLSFQFSFFFLFLHFLFTFFLSLFIFNFLSFFLHFHFSFFSLFFFLHFPFFSLFLFNFFLFM